MALTELRVRTAKATGKAYTLGDYDGLSRGIPNPLSRTITSERVELVVFE